MAHPQKKIDALQAPHFSSSPTTPWFVFQRTPRGTFVGFCPGPKRVLAGKLPFPCQFSQHFQAWFLKRELVVQNRRRFEAEMGWRLEPWSFWMHSGEDRLDQAGWRARVPKMLSGPFSSLAGSWEHRYSTDFICLEKFNKCVIFLWWKWQIMFFRPERSAKFHLIPLLSLAIGSCFMWRLESENRHFHILGKFSSL